MTDSTTAHLTDDVDPFLGNGASDPPPTKGLAATWFWPKAQTGNTHPGACYPYGMVSVGAYSGAYVTGYGLNRPSYDGQPERLFDTYTALGFAHFQQSGTGAIGSYYNYLRVTPLSGDFGRLGSRWGLEDETASPGYYAAGLKGTGIHAELTVAPRAAMHRYTFPGGSPATLAIDVSAGGLLIETMRTLPTEAAFELLATEGSAGANAAQGHVVMEGIPLYFYVEVSPATASWGTWTDGERAPGKQAWQQAGITPEAFTPFGFFFTFSEAALQVEVTLGFSVSSLDEARANAATLAGKGFDEVAAETRAAWEHALARIDIEGGTPAQRQIFRSMHYFSLIKPANFGASYWDGEGPFFFDLATMWDMHKTQLPLMLTFYPEQGRALVNAVLALAEHFGEFPNGFVLNTDIHQFDGQASGLAHVTLADAYARGLEGVDWAHAKSLMVEALTKGRGPTFAREGEVRPYTHTLDLAYACFLTAQLARDLGDEATYAELMRLAGNWHNVYDPQTGLLSDASRYYEGTLWNYSFRLSHDVAGRIGLFDSEAAFIETLDRFFGFGAPSCDQVVHRPYEGRMEAGFALGRFEGLNNEPDIEAPYIYIYAGRHDRTAEIVRAAMTQYHTGRGGLPGNDDSGGLASWFVWSAIGLFPVAGQGLYLIGSPLFDAATLTMGDATFRIETHNNSEAALYVRRATLNGLPLERAYLHHTELAAGGTLVLEMGTSPTAWAQASRPPSYRTGL